MSTMPNFIGFPLNYAIQTLAALGVAADLSYVEAVAPCTTMGIITAQTPAAGQQISNSVTLTSTGSLRLPDVGVTMESVPAVLVGNDDNPGGQSANS